MEGEEERGSWRVSRRKGGQRRAEALPSKHARTRGCIYCIYCRSAVLSYYWFAGPAHYTPMRPGADTKHTDKTPFQPWISVQGLDPSGRSLSFPLPGLLIHNRSCCISIDTHTGGTALPSFLTVQLIPCLDTQRNPTKPLAEVGLLRGLASLPLGHRQLFPLSICIEPCYVQH